MTQPKPKTIPLPTPTAVPPRELVRLILDGTTLDLPLDLSGNPDAPLPPRPKLTKGLKHTLARMKYAVESGSPLMLVVGTHGGGKSTAAKLFAEGQGGLYYEVPPQYRAKDVVADLCRRLGISVGEGYRLRTEVLVDFLRQHPRPILLDEAQRLKYEALDQLKYIADRAGVTVILIGSPWLENVVRRHSDISSRVWVRVEVEPITAEEFRRVYRPDGYPDPVLDAVHGVAEGVMRRAAAMLSHLDAALAHHRGMTRAELTPEHVRAAAEVVL
ncbi:hypothetical protein DAERI_060139 [Deinococcus aerius]|uniref:ORC1/DEAH AAA+ ATPase domain-containing protein n=1 Tax=Deinococcus aerius TaxID=200253 RepID=A0A2I9CVC6_9DEIO|nr:AAA family ATPase [Deinococcus aerius]GBF05879.1 hypothetical protein DAERI_060139 [Deinococcus aerius]